MPFKIIRNDITKMNTQAIVNTANCEVAVGPGCDMAVYQAAGYEQLLAYRRERIGEVPEGNAFITPGFNLKAEYIIHTVSPFFFDGKQDEESKLRDCYRNSLQLAKEYGILEIAFPLVSTGSLGYPKEEGMRIAVDEINAFLANNKMDIFLVVFDEKATHIGSHMFPDLESYIDDNYVAEKSKVEYEEEKEIKNDVCEMKDIQIPTILRASKVRLEMSKQVVDECGPLDSYLAFDFESEHEEKLEERMQHLSDTFSQYLLYLIQSKNMENAEVYKRAIVDKKTFSKIKNNINYHPQKITALCFCIGAKLNMDETTDLLARAGYALSPCDKTDIIFSYFIENKIYDMIELDIQLEEHGLPCIIS